MASPASRSVSVCRRTPDHEMIDWVIGKPQGEEAKVLRATLDRAAEAALCLMEEGADAAMNRFNG